MEVFLEANRPLIYFGYGLSFFLMGWTIWIQPRPASSLRLARSLPYLAIFGFLHGLAEWGHVFIPIQSQFLPVQWVRLLYMLHQLLFATSFLVLFRFGCFLIADSRKRLSWLPLLPLAVFGYWFFQFFLYQVFAVHPNDNVWTAYAEAMGRYLLAFPGAIAAAVGLYLQIPQFREANFPTIVPALRGAALAMGAYAFFTGLIVPYNDFFPANMLNKGFLLQYGIPAPIPRMICSITATFYIVRTLPVFAEEVRRRLENSETARAAAEEREHLGRELHDGILQSVYAAGLGLQTIRRRIKTDPEEAASRVDIIVGRLDRVIEEIRAYISNLDFVRPRPQGLRGSIAEVVGEFSATYGTAVDCRIDDLSAVDGCKQLCEQTVGIIRESLSNVGRHAAAERVAVRVEVCAEGLEVRISDNGRGFHLNEVQTNVGHYGLHILHRRAEMVGGTLQIDSKPGRGTTVAATLPLGQGGAH